jgi:predicted ATPase
LIHKKTGGNPFLTIQFITELEEEGLLRFEPGVAVWRWDVDRIHAKGYTANVVDLMVGKLSRLPNATQESLKQLACLGNRSEFELLRTVYGELSAAVRSLKAVTLQDPVMPVADGFLG